MENKLVSVCLITYNHEKFIRQAIEGVLMQQVDFQWELIIADDYSTDSTRQILAEYKARYPDFITLILQEKNVGAAQNWLDLIESPTSKFVAYFEGDDYWTDPLKLQKQVYFLESNPEFSQVFHNVIIKQDDGSKEDFLFCKSSQNPILETSDLLKHGNIIPTCSSVFHREIYQNVPAWIMELSMGDWPINILLSKHGKVKYLNEVMGVYRLHAGGIWSSNNSVKNNLMVLDAYCAFLINIHLTPDERDICKKRISFIRDSIYADLLMQKRKKEAVAFLMKRLATDPLYIFNVRFLKNVKHYFTSK
ncbi:MAG: glycosyltransferase [Chitinophagaceae bacterium]